MYKTSPNIGLVKYWGKWDEKEIIPLNDNIGVTLSQEDLYTITRVILIPGDGDKLFLNGKVFPISNRISRVLDIFRSFLPQINLYQVKEYVNDLPNEVQDDLISKHIDLSKVQVHITSFNSFPTGSGLASSSSGLSAFALCLNELVNPSPGENGFKISKPFDVRYISRISSGSSCRCLYGNFSSLLGVSDVSQGKVMEESQHCLPSEIIESRWVTECTYILIVVDHIEGNKDVLSTDGMQQTWQTSEFIQDRVDKYIRKHIEIVMQCLVSKDFNGLMKIIMVESNQFHSVCMDTYPPLFYLTELSKQIIRFVHDFNKKAQLHVGYTFDAGSHALLFIHQDSLDQFLQDFNDIYDVSSIEVNDRLKGRFKQALAPKQSKLVQPHQLILTKIGGGPQKLYDQSIFNGL